MATLSEVEIPEVGTPPLSTTPATLVGSRKQVDWAEHIRPKMLKRIGERDERLRSAAAVHIAAASWWIANRHKTFDAINWPWEWVPGSPQNGGPVGSAPPFKARRMPEPRVDPAPRATTQPMRPSTYPGLHNYRLMVSADNPRERAFAAVWSKVLQNSKTLAYMMHVGDQMGNVPDPSPHDVAVSSTVIQWLGSNVGMSFLAEVIKREPAVREWLSRELNQPAAALPDNPRHSTCPKCGELVEIIDGSYCCNECGHIY